MSKVNKRKAFKKLQTRLESRDKPRNLEFGLMFMHFGLLLWTLDDSGLPTHYHKDSCNISGFFVKILETAESSNSSLPFLFDFGLGLGLVNLCFYIWIFEQNMSKYILCIFIYSQGM